MPTAGTATRGLVLLVAVAALGLGGCGQETDEDEIRAAVNEANAAWTAGEVGQLCRDLLAPSEFPTERAKQRCVRQISEEPPTDSSFLMIDSVEIDGDTAQIEYAGGGSGSAVREDGRWYLSSAE